MRFLTVVAETTTARMQLRSWDCKARERDKPHELRGKEKGGGGGGAAIPCGQQDLECNFLGSEKTRMQRVPRRLRARNSMHVRPGRAGDM